MKQLYKYIGYIGLLNILLLLIGYYLISSGSLDIAFKDIPILSLLFSVITIISLLIFFRGQSKEPDSRILHSMVSISLKLLLEMILALGWFIIAKKSSLPYVLLFFVLYLTFTLFSILIMTKTLKNKSL